VLNHGGHPKEAAESPNAEVREKMSVEVVNDEAPAGDPLQLREKMNGVFPVKVVEEQGCVHNVNVVVWIRQVSGIPYVHLDLRAAGGSQFSVQVGPRVPHGDRVGIDSDEFCAAPECGGPAGKVDEIVSNSAAHVHDAEVIVALKHRVEKCIGRSVRHEQPIGQSEIPKSTRKSRIGDRKIVHPLLGVQPT